MLARGPTALVTLLAAEGSAPRGAGVRLVVDAARSEGTIGGGALEHQAIAQARAALALPPGSWRVQDYPLGPLLGQCCGGRVRIMVERLSVEDAEWLAEARDGRTLITRLAKDRVQRQVVDSVEPPTILPARGPTPSPGAVWTERLGRAQRLVRMFGVGHVGRAILRAAEPLPLTVTAFDMRPEAEIPGVTVADAAELETCAGQAPRACAVLILTHDHALDYVLVRAALTGEAGFVGLIGSRTKRARFLHRLAADGLEAPALARLVCPIGLPGIVGKEPEVIAIAVMAQLLALPNEGSLDLAGT